MLDCLFLLVHGYSLAGPTVIESTELVRLLMNDLYSGLLEEEGSGNDDSLSSSDVQLNLDRLYGIITDMFLDYHRLKGNTHLVRQAQSKHDSFVILIEHLVLGSFNVELVGQDPSSSLLPMNGEIRDETSNDNHGDQPRQRSSSSSSKVTTKSSSLDNAGSPLPVNRGKNEKDVFIAKLFQFWNVEY